MAGSGTAHLRDPDEALLRVEDLVVEFPVGRTGLKVNAVVEHQPRRAAGRDARPRRRVGLRQVDDRQGDHAAAPPDRRARSCSTASDLTDAARARTLRAAAPADADDLPGPDLVAEPAAQGRATSSPSRSRSGSVGTDGRARKQGRRGARRRRPRSRASRADRRPHQFSGGQCQRISHRPRARASTRS